jgi:hypothetical protein
VKASAVKTENKNNQSQIPTPETLDSLFKWAETVTEFIQNKLEEYETIQNHISQLLNEIKILLEKKDLKSNGYLLYSKLFLLVLHSNSIRMLSKGENTELSNRLSEYEKKIIPTFIRYDL